jgi:hypothetical protein
MQMFKRSLQMQEKGKEKEMLLLQILEVFRCACTGMRSSCAHL